MITHRTEQAHRNAVTRASNATQAKLADPPKNFEAAYARAMLAGAGLEKRVMPKILPPQPGYKPSPQQQLCLDNLKGQMTAAKLAEICGIPRQSASSALTSLVVRGLVKRANWVNGVTLWAKAGAEI